MVALDVSRVLYGMNAVVIISLESPLPTTSDVQCTSSTRPAPSRGLRVSQQCWNGSCLRLHAVGFAMPRTSPCGRCALTAPFHPCRPSKRGRRSVLCGTFPDLQPEVGGRYPPPCPVVLGLSSPKTFVNGAITFPISVYPRVRLSYPGKMKP